MPVARRKIDAAFTALDRRMGAAEAKLAEGIPGRRPEAWRLKCAAT